MNIECTQTNDLLTVYVPSQQFVELRLKSRNVYSQVWCVSVYVFM